MKQLLLWICIISLPFSAFSQKIEKSVSELTINFDNNKFDVKTSESQKIDALLQSLKEALPTYAIDISAFTDSNGSEESNKILSYKRAKSLAAYLIKKGFAAQTISFVAHGESNPMVENNSEEGRAENRRASLNIIENRDGKNSISGFTIKEELFPIDSQKPNVIKYSSGTEINIPENAFVDKNGNLVIGVVDVNYIEYRTPVDFILGNIPMDYKHDGEDYFFNSSGMFKIKATKDNEEVFLNKDKPIDIDFNLVNEIPDVDFYKFDTEKNVWIKDSLNVINSPKPINLDLFLEKVFVEEIGQRDVIASTAKLEIEANNEIKIDCASLFHYLTMGKALITNNDSVMVKISIMPIIYKNNNLKKQKGAAYQRSNSENAKRKFLIEQAKYHIKCDIDGWKDNLLKINVLTDSYIQRLNEVKWISSGQTENVKLKAIKLLGIEKKSKNLYVIIVKDSLNEKKFEELKVDGFNQQKEQMIDNIINQLKNRKIQMKRYDNLIATQDKIITDRTKKINYYKKIRYTTKDTVNLYVKMFDKFWNFNKEYMTSEEKELTKMEWLKYFDDNKTLFANRYKEVEAKKEYQECFKKQIEIQKQIEKQNRIYNAQVVARQKLKITSMGIYNCDQIQRLQQPLIVNAEYESESGEKILPVVIYVVDKNINGILRYDGYNGYSPFRFAYSPLSETTLLAFDTDGNTYVYESKKMEKLDKAKMFHKFIVTKIETISNKKQLESLLQ